MPLSMGYPLRHILNSSESTLVFQPINGFYQADKMG